MPTSSLSTAGAWALLSVSCLTIMVGCVIVPGLPSISAQLGVPGAASWLVTLPSLGVVVLSPLAAWLLNALGMRRTLLLGLFLYGALGAGGMLLRGAETVLVSRFLLGFPTAIVMSAGTGLISAFFSGEARLRMIARQGMAIELGGVVFLALSGILAARGWRQPFFLYLVAWALMVVVWRLVPEPAASQPRTADRMAAMGPLPHGLKIAYVAAAGSMMVFFAAVVILPIRLHQLGWNAAQAGYLLSFVSLVAVGAAWLMPRVTARMRTEGTLGAAFALYALGHLCFAVVATAPLLALGAVAIGCGFGLSIPLCNHVTVEQSAAHQRNKHLAYLSIAVFGGQFLSSFLAYLPGDSSTVFLVTAVLSLAGGLSFGRSALS
jgi:MFS family permease